MGPLVFRLMINPNPAGPVVVNESAGARSNPAFDVTQTTSIRLLGTALLSGGECIRNVRGDGLGPLDYSCSLCLLLHLRLCP